MKLFSFEIVKIGLEENVLTINQTNEGRTIVFSQRSRLKKTNKRNNDNEQT